MRAHASPRLITDLSSRLGLRTYNANMIGHGTVDFVANVLPALFS